MKQLALILACTFLALAAFPAQKPELIPYWAESDEQNTATIDHSDWQSILNTYLKEHPSGVNRFDYASLKAVPTDLKRLNTYLEKLQSTDPRDHARAEQKAYWINFYNALTVKIVVDAYPVDSIKEIHESWIPRSGPWGDVHANVVGQDLTLDNIEHGILRPIWKDERIHYAVNCASIGCPNLAKDVYTAANLDSLLDEGARAYVNHSRGVDVVDEDFIVLSSIYDWWAFDFGDSEEGVIVHLIKYANEDLGDLLRNFSGAIDYEYDWDLNQP